MADLLDDSTILFSLPHPLRASAVSVSYSEQKHRRVPHSPTEHRIAEEWQAQLAENPRLFDGSKFRLHGCRVVAGSGAVELRVGLTGYRDYIGTHRRSAAEHATLLAAGGVGGGSGGIRYQVL